MRESPRIRRLRTDLRALESLREQSTIVDFKIPDQPGGLPDTYIVRFRGKGLWRPPDTEDVLPRENHEVSIQLGASYPRSMPDLSWRTPIFHPNISSSGVVCLGGYGSHWAPSLNLGELCTMLWDMIRYHNYDVQSPYNREAALWANSQERYRFPIDARPIRDRLAGVAPPRDATRTPPISGPPREATDGEILFVNEHDIVDAEIVEAEIVEPDEDPDVIYIE